MTGKAHSMTRHTRDIERLRKIVETFPKLTVTVLGDLVADVFIHGEIQRVSREAPVLILKHRERVVVPGGGANAVFNLADLGVNVLPVGVIGDDESGRVLLRQFKKKRIAVSGIVRDKAFTTVTKTRIMAYHAHSPRQQVVRIDREPEHAPQASVTRALILDAREYAKASDAMMLSDYGYGSVTPEIFAEVRAKISGDLPVTLDSRHRLLQYAGVTAAAPNESEVEEALGVTIGTDWERLVACGGEVMKRMKLESLVVTRGRDGMVAFAGNGSTRKPRKPLDIPIFGTDEVADVTGAGDTVIAVYTAALAASASPEDAALLANYAGGIVVMKRGTATVTREELLHAMEHGHPAVRAH